MKATMTITDCGTDSGFSVECTASVHSSKSSNSSSSSAYIAGGAMIGSVSLIAAIFFVRKRRNIGTINLLDEEEKRNASTGHFEMMSDSVRV